MGITPSVYVSVNLSFTLFWQENKLKTKRIDNNLLVDILTTLI